MFTPERGSTAPHYTKQIYFKIEKMNSAKIVTFFFLLCIINSQNMHNYKKTIEKLKIPEKLFISVSSYFLLFSYRKIYDFFSRKIMANLNKTQKLKTMVSTVPPNTVVRMSRTLLL